MGHLMKMVKWILSRKVDTFLDNRSGPTIIGCDFNLMTSVKEKNNGIVNQNCVDFFIDWMNKFGLVELKNSSRSYTWTNNQEHLVMVAIDKFLCNMAF